MSLDSPFIKVCILDCDGMSVFLILASVCILIDPFAIVLRESIEVDPKSSWKISYNSLRPIEVDWDFVILILDIGEGGGWIAVAIKVIVFLFWEESIVIFVFKELSFHSEPSVWIGDKFILVINRSIYFKIEILKIVCLGSCDCFDFELIFSWFEDGD